MSKRLLFVLICLVVAACSSGNTTDTTGPATDDATADEGGSAATITMSDFSFSGATSAQVGDTIELVNEDDVPHTFTAEDETFDVSISAGETETYTFEEAGEFPYFCEIHPAMEGVITVEG